MGGEFGLGESRGVEGCDVLDGEAGVAAGAWMFGGSFDVVAFEVGVNGLGRAVVTGGDLSDGELFVLDC